jgi:GT2 family glycosyltransferase
MQNIRSSQGTISSPQGAHATVGIGITTRDRWRDLAQTLEHVEAYEDFAACHIVVIDDGSENPCPKSLHERFPRVCFMRDEIPRGLIAQRNRLAALFETDYYLSLDDDSFPVSGSLKDAVEYLKRHPYIVCLAFNLVNQPEDLPRLPPTRAPFRVRLFIGCGHLMDRRKFLEMGGYSEELFFYNEEWDLSARAADRQWQVLCYPALVICHFRGASHRSPAARSYFYVRGKVLVGLLTLPAVVAPISLVFALFSAQRVMAWNLKSVLRGFCSGLLDGLGFLYQSKDRRIALDTYLEWRRLPWPPNC